MKDTERLEIPTSAELKEMLRKEDYRQRYLKILRSTVSTLITVAAIAVLIAVFLLPVLQIYGHSMSPSMDDGDIVLSAKTAEADTQDIIAFYYNNKVLVKRVIARSGDWVDIDKDGNVYINRELIDEPYLEEKAFGECNIPLPYQVPEGKVFVMGDHRSVSIDSRSTAVGCVSEEQIVGRLMFRIWPLNKIGAVH